MDQHAAEDGVYRIPAMKGLFKGVTRELADAVPPLAPSAPPLVWNGGEPVQPRDAAGLSEESPAGRLSALLAMLKTSEPSDLSEPADRDADALSPEAPARRYGWIAGALPTPDPEGRYIVEFVDRRDVRILAYLDRYGRAFRTDETLDSHPAREPDLKFSRYADQPDPEVLQGCVEVRDKAGAWREVARFSRFGERYALFDSWFDFSGHGADLSYADALSRSYLAFVHRPTLGAPQVPARGLDGVEAPLDALPALPALRKVQSDIVRAQWDPALRPPALACALARWFSQAGIDDLALAPSGSLRLVRTIRYADIYYLATTEEGASLSMRPVWGLQNALNRYLLVKRACKDGTSVATVADVLRWDAYDIEAFAMGPVERLVSKPADEVGEWELRRRISTSMEMLAAPLRFEAEFRADVEAGIVSFAAVVPDADMMPLQRWDGPSQAVVDATGHERAAQAVRYAEHLALVLAAAAFSGDARVERVEFTAFPLREEGFTSLGDALAAAGEAGTEGGSAATGVLSLLPKPHLRVLMDRERFMEKCSAAAMSDPTPVFAGWGALLAENALAPGAPAARYPEQGPEGAGKISYSGPFSSLTALSSARLRRDMPECVDAELPESARAALGARWVHDLRIYSDALHRRQAERLANRLAPVTSTTEAIRAVRRRQNRADDPFIDQACTRLMAAIAEGEVDVADQNTVIQSYLGQDKCQSALARARALAQSGDAVAAGDVLSKAAWEAEEDGRYVDGAEVVYRNFDNYPSRVLYNLIREGSLPGFGGSLGDDAKAAGEPGALARVEESFEDEDARLLLDEAARVLSDASPADVPGFGEDDHDKRVELVPDSLLRCHMEASKLLERSFSGIDEALAHARRAAELAPTATAPRCLLARLYMLMGDMASASKALEAGLSLATQPSDIAVAYYQLAYARWKAGEPRVGAACYVKSIAAAPLVAAQAAVELQDLLSQERVKLPGRAEVDDILGDAGIPAAPSDTVLDALAEAARRAVDVGAFTVGRSLLATYLSHRPEDALMGVYRSLGDLPM